MSSPNFQREFRLPLPSIHILAAPVMLRHFGNVQKPFCKCYTVLNPSSSLRTNLAFTGKSFKKCWISLLDVLIYQWDCVKDWVILSPKLASQYSVVVIYLLGPPPPAYQEQFRVLERYKAWNSGKNIDTNICHQNRTVEWWSNWKVEIGEAASGKKAVKEKINSCPWLS